MSGAGRYALASAFFLAATAHVSAASIQPASRTVALPDVSVIDETDQRTTLRATLQAMGQGPFILLPMFTRCSGSCPILTHKLETARSDQQPAGGNARYRVLLFSFDPLETSASLRLFRERNHIPAEWEMVRSDVAGIRAVFGSLGYNVMNLDGRLVHPNEMFLLDQQLSWRWTLVGADWDSKELTTALARTRSPGLGDWVRGNPQLLGWIGFLLLTLSVGAASAVAVRYRRN